MNTKIYNAIKALEEALTEYSKDPKCSGLRKCIYSINTRTVAFDHVETTVHVVWPRLWEMFKGRVGEGVWCRVSESTDNDPKMAHIDFYEDGSTIHYTGIVYIDELSWMMTEQQRAAIDLGAMPITDALRLFVAWEDEV